MVSLSTPHVQVARAGVRLFCSADCMKAALHGRPKEPVVHPSPASHASEPVEYARKPRLSRSKLFAIVLGVGSLSPCTHVAEISDKLVHTAAVTSRSAEAAAVSRKNVGPPVPDDEARALEFMGELSGDRWIHPLPGPERRMPIRTSRVFGASRHGDRPGECRSGHCGVDIGGEMWGEPVMAVHDGVVDRVKRVDEGRGGLYVRIAHRDGTVFTQYFHLAAIPRDLSAGDKVKAGQIIGLVGDTGVKESNPHLHFAVSVKPTPTGREIYMDPEPLIALWPVKTPRATGGADAVWDPGVPLGAVGRARLDGAGKPLARKADRKRKKRAAGTTAAMPTETAPSDDAVEAASDSIGDAYESGGDSSSDADSGDSSGASSAAAKSPAAARFPFSPQPTQQ
jgi:murein DD-endopeptidase MepM/ murein hydrolase activator NlpD